IRGGGDYWKNQSLKALAMTTSQGGFITSTSSPNGDGRPDPEPDHLLVLVHGIYASSCNTYSKTFSGIDGSGKRLADESCKYLSTSPGKVKQIVKSRDNLKKISFLAHSLGGLIARYAVGVLHTSTRSDDNSSNNGTIAGLEAINFITLATPHLGVRGSKQLPFLLGVPILEKIAAPLAPMFVGRTGTQLFLTDGKPEKPPLLLRMTTDSQEADFISALGAFRYRILYANVSYDHMVGWRTSSIRRESELVKPPFKSLDGYKHVVDVEYCPPVVSTGANFPPEAARAKEAAQNVPTTQNTLEYHEIMEEEMIRGLQQLGWKKVDVSFHASFWPFFAHNNIHVKDEWFHKAGAGVIAHVADSINQQEKQHQTTSLISASL
ncbi:hydrolase-like protein, partial [Tanacetum coccineum]